MISKRWDYISKPQTDLIGNEVLNSMYRNPSREANSLPFNEEIVSVLGKWNVLCHIHNSRKKGKDKVIPLQVRCGPEGG